MTKKCCFIIPYFGKLPNYFQLFLHSCAYNKSYDWLLLTDDTTPFVYPDNVKRVSMDFSCLKQMFTSKLEMEIALSKPYKLCDFKPAYGFLFSEYLTDYKFWGHCDIDTIVGCLDNFITDELLDNFDKIFCLGHFILYRNTPGINKVFMTGDHYKKIFSTEDICFFDETPSRDITITIEKLFKDRQLRIFSKSFAMNVHVPGTLFHQHEYIRDCDEYIKKQGYFKLERNKKALYIWKEGKILRFYMNKTNEMVKEEFMYIHLQKRKMRMLMNPNEKMQMFKIVPNAFMPFHHDTITPSILKQERKPYVDTRILKHFTLDYLAKIAGFILAIRRGKNPFKVEILRSNNKIWWQPSLWCRWIEILPKQND